MKRLHCLAIMVALATLAACRENSSNNEAMTTTVNDLDPTTVSVPTPPVSGTLPDELRPPAS